MSRRNEKLLRPVFPNAGIERAYRRKMQALVHEMARSYHYWLCACWRKKAPVMAQDASPAIDLEKTLRKLFRYWDRRFRAAAPKLAAYFSLAAHKRSDAVLRKILRDSGISVQFRMTRGMQDILSATLAENVGLIRSIPEQYHTQVQGLVMRSVQTGRDLHQLTRDLKQRYDITQARAELIARDQNNKATSAMNRARQAELGITEAVWLHSHGGKKPRKTHIANHGKRYSTAEGWYDPDPKVRKRIWPGELINCFPGSTKIQFAHGVGKAYRRWYRGDLTEIIADANEALRATPNHPVLTPNGWRPIGSLHEGDYVVKLREDCVETVMPEGYENDAKPMIIEIFDALAKAGSRGLEVSLRDQFHGDGLSNGYVDVVFAARALSFGRQLLSHESEKQIAFSESAQATFFSRLFQQFLARGFHSATALIRSLGEPFTPYGTFALHADKGSGSTISYLTASRDYARDNHGPFHSMQTSQSQNTHSRFMPPTKFVRLTQINRSFFEGHIFNLQTESGCYAAESFIVHNCRCVSKSVVRGFT